MGEAADPDAPRSEQVQREIGDRVLVVSQGIPAAKPYRDASIRETLDFGERPTIGEDTETGGSSVAAVVSGVSIVRLALKNLLRNTRRSLFACAAIGFGVIAILLAGGFIEWVLDAMRESTIRSQLGHIQVNRVGFQEGGQADPFAFLLPQEAEELQKVEDVSNVQVVAPRLFFSGLLSFGETTISFTGQGIDPAREMDLSESVTISEGQNLSGEDEQGAILGVGLARNVGADVGDKVVLLANTERGTINAVELTVRGKFFTPVKAFDDSALRIHINSARQLLRSEGSHSWLVLLDETTQTDSTFEKFKTIFEGDKFEVLPWYELADFFNKTVRLFGRQVALVATIIGLLILLSISNTMMMNVMERTSEIGTLMAIGLRRSRVRTLFLCEGILLGVVGGLLGVGLGWVLATVISYVGIPMPPPPGMAVGFTGEILLTPKLMLSGFMVAIVATSLATIYPAIRASKLNVVDALRHGR